MSTNRRDFLKQSAAVGTGLFATSLFKPSALWAKAQNATLPAIAGGSKAHSVSWPRWPQWVSPEYDGRVLAVLKSGVWSRARTADEFEQKWAEMCGTKRCLATVNGTNALIVALSQAGVGVGDEVIVTPYTFVASVQAILMNGAIPVFADIDRKTFQIDPKNIEKKITPRTKAILPVHILGMPADMTSILKIAKKHNIIVIEDACQAHLAEINHKRVGSLGFAGCFSFQNSKNIPIGEGGAIVSDNDEFMDKCYSYHNLGFPYGSQAGTLSGSQMIGTKVRFSEYQAAIGIEMLKKGEEQAQKRWENGQYLNARLKGFDGIKTVKQYPETTRAVYHLYPLRYDKKAFKDMPRDLFLKALNAEGINSHFGYTPLETQPFIKAAFESRLYQRAYDPKDIDYKSYMESNICPENDRLCNEEAIWIYQNMLLAGKSDMDDIVYAIKKIRDNAELIIKKYNAGEIK